MRNWLLTFAILLLEFPSHASTLPGDSESDAIKENGEPRARIPLPDGSTLIAFERGEIWVRNGKVIKTDLLSANAFAERQKAEFERRLREESERLLAEESNQRRIKALDEQRLRSEAEQRRLDEIVRREALGLPATDENVASVFGPFRPTNTLKDGTRGIAILLADESEHQADSRGTLNRVFLDVLHTGETPVYSSRLLTTFYDREGRILRSVHEYVGVLLPGECRPVTLNVRDSSPRRGIGDGSKVMEIRFDLFSQEGVRLPIFQSRWVRVSEMSAK